MRLLESLGSQVRAPAYHCQHSTSLQLTLSPGGLFVHFNPYHDYNKFPSLPQHCVSIFFVRFTHKPQHTRASLSVEQDRPCKYKGNNEVRWRKKKMSITYSECVSVALSYPASEAHAPYYIRLSGSTIF